MQLCYAFLYNKVSPQLCKYFFVCFSSGNINSVLKVQGYTFLSTARINGWFCKNFSAMVQNVAGMCTCNWHRMFISKHPTCTRHNRIRHLYPHRFCNPREQILIRIYLGTCFIRIHKSFKFGNKKQFREIFNIKFSRKCRIMPMPGVGDFLSVICYVKRINFFVYRSIERSCIFLFYDNLQTS